ncbi:hypothetical protein LEMLEM_LOCUS19809, partial [Lemmus lemmus]
MLNSPALCQYFTARAEPVVQEDFLHLVWCSQLSRVSSNTDSLRQNPQPCHSPAASREQRCLCGLS